MSFKRRKISAPGRLTGPTSRSRTGSITPSYEVVDDETPPHQHRLLGRTFSGQENGRVFERNRNDSLRALEIAPEQKVIDEISDENIDITNIEIDNPGEITLFYLINEFLNLSQTKIENFVSQVGMLACVERYKSALPVTN